MRTDTAKETYPFCNFKLRTFQNYYAVIGVISCSVEFRTPLYLAVGLRTACDVGIPAVLSVSAYCVFIYV